MSSKSSKPQGRIIIISGPSGCGKTTLHKGLLASGMVKGKVVKSISATTRERRPGERQGRDYLFLSAKTFERRAKRGFFLEWEKVFDHYYGTPRKQAMDLINKGINVLLCIDVKGASTVAKEFHDALKIFIKTPSLKVLKARLRSRGSESSQSFKLRLKTARQELKEASTYDYVVVNADLKKALRRLLQIVKQTVPGIQDPPVSSDPKGLRLGERLD